MCEVQIYVHSIMLTSIKVMNGSMFVVRSYKKLKWSRQCNTDRQMIILISIISFNNEGHKKRANLTSQIYGCVCTQGCNQDELSARAYNEQ